MKRVWLAMALLAACGHDGGQAGVDGNGSGSDGSGSADSGVGDGWTKLISRTWTLAPGFQGYKCVRIQVPSEMWVTGFRALSPVGTHHQVLTISNSSSPLGDYDCSAGTLDQQMMYAAGVNTDDLLFPTGVATHLTAGMYVNLNLHLFNASDNQINGESGIFVQTIPAAQVVHPADMMFSGTFNISIPSDNMPHTASGGCTAPTDWHLFTLWPHMHQTATHQTFTVTHAGTPNTMLDVPYAFGEQKNYPMAETIIHQGDGVQTTCTYVNNSGHTITFGDSSLQEMCFTGMYKYPAGGNIFGCTSQ